MAKRSRKILAGTPLPVTCNITETDWQQIEAAYGRELPNNVRKAITEATEKFLFWDSVAHAGEPLAHAEAIIENYKKAAAVFRHALAVHDGSAAGACAKIVIEVELKHLPLSVLGSIGQVSQTVFAFEAACSKALSPKSLLRVSMEEGEPWQGWVQLLTQIMRQHALPLGASKTNSGQSPFIALVRELQKCLSVQHRRHTHSEEALAAAIVRARRYVPQSTPTISQSTARDE